jgi:hypothetical protein
MTILSNCSLQKELELELERLKQKLKMGYELSVLYIPKTNSILSGEVKGKFIYVYDLDREVAFETLKHEFIDYAISKTIEPYKEVSNRLIDWINQEAYQRKENLVELLTRMVS